MSTDDIATARKPAMKPPNQALPMTAAKKRNTNGYAMTCCKGKVHNKATSTKQLAIAHGLIPYWKVQPESRFRVKTVILAS